MERYAEYRQKFMAFVEGYFGALDAVVNDSSLSSEEKVQRATAISEEYGIEAGWLED